MSGCSFRPTELREAESCTWRGTNRTSGCSSDRQWFAPSLCNGNNHIIILYHLYHGQWRLGRGCIRLYRIQITSYTPHIDRPNFPHNSFLPRQDSLATTIYKLTFFSACSLTVANSLEGTFPGWIPHRNSVVVTQSPLTTEPALQYRTF